MKKLLQALLSENIKINDDLQVPLKFCISNSTESATVQITTVGNPVVDGLQYKIADTWQNYTIGETITITKDSPVQFKNLNSQLSVDSNNYITFVISGSSPAVYAVGNIMSLLNYSDSCTSYCFFKLFYNCTKLKIRYLKETLTLPSLKLAPYCYQYMFLGTYIDKTPDLPATELPDYCYSLMFKNCTNLKSISSLPATSLAGGIGQYQGMFSTCTKLEQSIDLPATELSNKCYSSMFINCTLLTKAPKLPATELKSQCYYSMFSGCRNLINAPYLPAIELTTDCYKQMFKDCTSLKQISVEFTNWYENKNATLDWVNGVTSTERKFLCSIRIIRQL